MKKILTFILLCAAFCASAKTLTLPNGSKLEVSDTTTLVTVEMVPGPPPSILVSEIVITRTNGVRQESRKEHKVECDPVKCLAQRFELYGQIKAGR